jgi:hypothetical protein
MGGMRDSDRKPASVVFWAVVTLLVCTGLMIAYVLSIGPVCWLMLHDYVSDDSYAAIYKPLISAGGKFQPLGDFLVYWVTLWNPVEWP